MDLLQGIALTLISSLPGTSLGTATGRALILPPRLSGRGILTEDSLSGPIMLFLAGVAKLTFPCSRLIAVLLDNVAHIVLAPTAGGAHEIAEAIGQALSNIEG